MKDTQGHPTRFTHASDSYVPYVIGYACSKVLTDPLLSSSSTTGAFGIHTSPLPDFLAVFLPMLACSALLAFVGTRRRAHVILKSAALVSYILLVLYNVLIHFNGVDFIGTTAWRILLSAVGMASIIGKAFWLILLGSLQPRRCMALLLAGMLLGSVAGILVFALPTDGHLEIALLGVAAAVLCLLTPRPTGAPSPGTVASGGPRLLTGAHRVDIGLSGPLLIFACVETVLGLIASFGPLPEDLAFADVLAKKVASCCAYLFAFFYVRTASVSLSVIGLYGRAIPLLAFLIFLLPLSVTIPRIVLDATLSALLAIVSAFTIWLLIEYCQQQGLPLTSGVGLLLFVSSASIGIGRVVGNALGARDGNLGVFLLAMVAVYILMTLFVVISRRSQKDTPEVDIRQLDDATELAEQRNRGSHGGHISRGGRSQPGRVAERSVRTHCP